MPVSLCDDLFHCKALYMVHSICLISRELNKVPVSGSHSLQCSNNLMSSSMVVELDVHFIKLNISSVTGSCTRIGIQARWTWLELGWPPTKSDPRSGFAPGQPSSNHVNGPQDPIQAQLSIALQITSSVGWLLSSITHNNRGRCSNSTSDLASLKKKG